jgi:hypothetical protein
MAAKPGESRTGLVVFLVLFVLLSIILGVTTYLGYSEIDAQKKAATEATAAKNVMEKKASWYQFLAGTYRSYIGYPTFAGDETVTLRQGYQDGAGPLFTGTDDKAKEEHRKSIADLDGKKKWNNDLKKPSETYQDEVNALTKKLADAQRAATEATKKANDANELAESTKRELEAARKDYDTKLAAQKQQDAKDLEGLRLQLADTQKKLSEKGDQVLADQKKYNDDNDVLRKDNAKKDADLKRAIKTINERRDELARLQSAEDIDVSKVAPENLAKVLSIDSTGNMPYINLGSADNLKRQVTFSIFGRGADGRALREPKGKLEVVRITGEHTAQARITELRDERRDPVLPGDYIYNPAWNPNLKQHVAIIGTIDLTGDGHDNIQEFLRTLKNQNVEVDAYLDMKTRKLKRPDSDAPGEITRQTDLLIVGAGPEGTRNARIGGDEKDVILKTMQDVTVQAEKLGVRIVRLNNYLETSGYALPKTMGAEKGKIGFQRNLEAAGSPVDRKPPQQPQK